MTPERIRLVDCEGFAELLAELRSLGTEVEGNKEITDAKFVTFRTLVDSQAEKVKLALDAADKAVSKAETATEKRFEGVNEFRGQLADQTATLVSRSEFHTKSESLAEKLSDLTDRINRNEGKNTGISNVWGWVVGAAGMVSAVVVAANAYFTR